MESIYEEHQDGFPPEKVVQIMAKHGEQITLEEAKKMLEIVKIFTGIAISQYLRDG